MLDFVYLLTEPGITLETSPGLSAQIIDRIRVQRSKGLSIGVVTAVSDQAAFDERVAPVLRETGTPFIGVRSTLFPARLTKMALATRKMVRNHGARLVYVRDLWSSLTHKIAFPLRGPDLVYDMRGDLLAEARLRGRAGLKLWTLTRLTSMAIRHAHQYAGVSSYTAELLRTEYGARDVTVIPSCVDINSYRQPASEREAIRRELGISPDEVLVVYAGGTHRYQMIPEMLRVWEQMAENERIRFLLLTHETERSSGLESELPESRLIRMSVDRDRVAAYLAASDVGFLLRTSHPLNRTASPIKFGEYLASGLSVISSPGLGDISRLIEENDVGVLVETGNPEAAAQVSTRHIETLRASNTSDADRSRALARTHFDWAAHVPAWNSMLARADRSS